MLKGLLNIYTNFRNLKPKITNHRWVKIRMLIKIRLLVCNACMEVPEKCQWVVDGYLADQLHCHFQLKLD